VLGRLVEGHVDAVAILDGAGRRPVTGAAYGVWASASRGTGLRAARHDGGGRRLTGRLRYCTGAGRVDRALVTARTAADELLLFDVPVRGPGWQPMPGTWPAVGMDLSDSLDVEVDALAADDDQVGPEGHYLRRRGFALGGIGVAAVWLGGAAGVLDAVADGLRRFDADPHQLAHLGAMVTAVLAADALLGRTAADAERLDGGELPAAALACRSGVEAAVETVLRHAPRLTGPTPLCRDGDLAHRLADLQVYVRQHHAERDLAELGGIALDAGVLGHRFGA
jgi:alkylation response protein AidB-like acyl-CoA dehydrogenase